MGSLTAPNLPALNLPASCLSPLFPCPWWEHKAGQAVPMGPCCAQLTLPPAPALPTFPQECWGGHRGMNTR